VRVAFALDCCDREAMSFLATTSGVSGEDVRDLMLAAVEHRFGPINRLPVTIEWLSDNGSCYVADETRRFARDIGLEPRTTPIESPQSNGMAEAFVRTIKRDYVRVSPRPDAQTVMHQLSAWINHYNEVHPHKALGYRSEKCCHTPGRFVNRRSIICTFSSLIVLSTSSAVAQLRAMIFLPGLTATACLNDLCSTRSAAA
jgi:putative transposase